MEPFALCRFRQRLPLSSDRFLWAEGPNGVFQSASPADQREIASQDTRFAVQVFLDRPLAVLGSSLASVGKQLSLIEMAVFNYPDFRREGFRKSLPKGIYDDASGTRAFAQAMPATYLAYLGPIIALLSLMIIGVWSWRHHRREPQRTAFAVTVACAFFVNAAVFGILSTPHGRYQNRIIWILPLVALPLASWRTKATAEN